MLKDKAKKILIISPHFYPENFKCNDVAFEFANRGYEVTVLSDIPNYPGGKFFEGYNVFHKRKEIVNGVKIIRTLVIPRGNGNAIRLALNYASFAITASIHALFMGIFQKYDAIIVHETSPITVGIPAIIIKKIRKKTKLLFWVLDLWPESLQVAGGINNRKVLNIFEKIAKSCYRNSDKIMISSRGFRQSIVEKGDFSDKLVYFPNWAEGCLNTISNYKMPFLPDGFKIMFTGNIGEAQDFEHMIEAAKILVRKGRTDIHFIIVGDGRKKSWIEKCIEETPGLIETVHLVGRHPLESMGLFFDKADVLYFALKDSLIFNLTCPAKLQAYMSSGKPILAMINGEGKNIVEDAKCGLSVSAGDSLELASTIEKMAEMSKEQLSDMGLDGKKYCEKFFSFNNNMKILERLIL